MSKRRKATAEEHLVMKFYGMSIEELRGGEYASSHEAQSLLRRIRSLVAREVKRAALAERVRACGIIAGEQTKCFNVHNRNPAMVCDSIIQAIVGTKPPSAKQRRKQ